MASFSAATALFLFLLGISDTCRVLKKADVYIIFGRNLLIFR